MNNQDCVIAVLAAHREARRWDDQAVAADLLAQLDLKPDGEAKNAKPVVPPGITEDEVRAHEAAAKEAADKAKAAREALQAQQNDGKQDDKAKTAAAEADQKSAADEASKRRANTPPAGPLTTGQLENAPKK